jgi:iron complex outermembrane recepter protein
MIHFGYRLLMGTALATLTSAAAFAQTSSAGPSEETAGKRFDTVIVTAQKREQDINDVGMAISVQTGDQLREQGIESVADLSKVVPGFTYEGAPGRPPIYSIRGVGFHDLSMASGQTVAVYSDEVPIPFGFETIGVDFDIDRVEVLKGPQGTLFGQNSTGGAINYVMAKPTDTLEYGVDLSYGSFSTSDVQGFVSGPISNTLKGRVAFRSIQGDGWQERYGPLPTDAEPRSLATNGKRNQFAMRALLEWDPTDNLNLLFNMNTRQDRSDTQIPQYNGLRPSSSQPPIPEIVAFPLPPEDNRAAAWDPGVDYSQDNDWSEASLRAVYDLGDVRITSISAYQEYERAAPSGEYDATPYAAVRYGFFGNVETLYQELRAEGTFNNVGSWLIGANYEHDETEELATLYNPLATSRLLFGLPNRGSESISNNEISTAGIFANVEYPVLDNVTLQLGARYNETSRKSNGCTRDSGNGDLAAIFTTIQTVFSGFGIKTTPIVAIQPGECITLDAAFNPGLFEGELDEDNISWRGGINWDVTPDTLIFANASKGFKAGSYPLVAASSSVQFTPVPQEELLAYEVGFKSRVTDTIQLNASAFLYDYSDKQINGSFFDPTFGRLTKLVSIPESQVTGFEATLNWYPIDGLTISPGVSYVDSEIQGVFENVTPTNVLQSFSGERFPYAPEWQGNVAARYEWSIGSGLNAFIGGNVSYQSDTNGAFGELDSYAIDGYTLVDLRAGIESESGAYQFSIWGSNVFDEYYWLTSARNFDSDARATGQPARFGVALSYRFE